MHGAGRGAWPAPAAGHPHCYRDWRPGDFVRRRAAARSILRLCVRPAGAHTPSLWRCVTYCSLLVPVLQVLADPHRHLVLELLVAAHERLPCSAGIRGALELRSRGSIARLRAARMPSFAEAIAWPPSDSAELRRLRCPPAIVASMDGAMAALTQLCEEADVSPVAAFRASQRPEELASRVRLLARDCIDYSWEELHSGPWSSVPIVWREVYGTAVLMLVASRLLLTQLTAGDNATRRPLFSSCMKLLDLGIMMGGPRTQPVLHSAVAETERIAAPADPDVFLSAPLSCDEEPLSKRHRNTAGLSATAPSTVTPARLPLPPQMKKASLTGVSRRSLPPLEVFLQQHMKCRHPVVLTDAMREWPAMMPISTPDSSPVVSHSDAQPLRHGRWADMGYLKRIAGMRTVPVEVGDTYLSKQWRQEMMTFQDFISRHIEMESSPCTEQACSTLEPKRMHDTQPQQPEETRAGKAYLAQHPLFDQIPRLRDDIVTPPYCYLTERSDGGDVEPAVNGWFGPEGTVTPCHYDPKHNLLCQVVGRKYVRLWPADTNPKDPNWSKDGSALYPHMKGIHTNSSQVDVRNPDLTAYPRYATAPYFECVLEPGEILYIPPRWWHYVQSMECSFSCSFWWE